MIICNQCGASLKDEVRFCKECGAAVLGTSRPATPAAHPPSFVTGEPPAPTPRPSFTVPLIIGGLCLGVFLLLLVIDRNPSRDYATNSSYASASNTANANSSSNHSSNNAYVNTSGSMNTPAARNTNMGGSTPSSPPANNHASSAGKWLVILSGNASLLKAQEFARKIEAYRPTMYLREGLYRTTIGPYRTKDIAIRARDQFRLEIIEDAYVENIDTWCKKPTLSEGIFRCE